MLDEITVRDLRYRVEMPDYPIREITLVTALQDAMAHPAWRWPNPAF